MKQTTINNIIVGLGTALVVASTAYFQKKVVDSYIKKDKEA